MKINETRLKEIIAEEMAAIEDKQYLDHTDNEGGMARRQLENLAQYAHELASMMEENTQLEGWVQSKITLANDYISKVKHYLEDELGMTSSGCGQPAEPLMVMDGEEVYEIDDEDAYLMET
jgi:hypothetical protein